MKLKDIQEKWAKDSKIEKTQLDDEATKVPYLHNEYWKILVNEKLFLRKKKDELARLKKLKVEYYTGKFAKEDYQETGWPHMDMVILKQDLPLYLESDDHIADMNIEIVHQEQKCKYVEDIIKSLHNRGFLLKTAMDFIKFTGGG